jgi:hypothetical protein
MAEVAGRGLQPPTPDLGPDSANESGVGSILGADALAYRDAEPVCPCCGAEMSWFPLIVFCGMCEFFIEAPGRRPSESMGPLREPYGLLAL